MQKQTREQEEQQLLAYFRKMTDKDRKAGLAFFAASARENPKKVPDLRLVASRRTAA